MPRDKSSCASSGPNAAPSSSGNATCPKGAKPSEVNGSATKEVRPEAPARDDDAIVSTVAWPRNREVPSTLALVRGTAPTPRDDDDDARDTHAIRDETESTETDITDPRETPGDADACGGDRSVLGMTRNRNEN